MLHQETAATLVKRGLTRYSAPHDGAGFPIRARRPESVLVGWRVTASAACWLVAGLLTVAVGRDPGSELPDGEQLRGLTPAVRQLVLEYFERLNRAPAGAPTTP